MAERTYDGLAVMSEVSGLSRATMAEIWDEVKANQAKLSACPVHVFSPAVAGSRKRICSACGGWVSVTDAGWYERGFRAGSTGSHGG